MIKSGDVAERSPAVISANLKEGMILNRKLVVLNRSERAVVHQIKVDQKVLYKRFQARITRSKLAHARLLGQRDVQRELRSKNLGDLNTNIVGASEEDYLFLEKLQQRPCEESSFTPRIESPRKSVIKRQHSSEAKRDSDAENYKDENVILEQGRASSATPRMTSDGHCKQETKERVEEQAKIRPATSLGMHVDQEFIKHQNQLMSANLNKTQVDNVQKSDENTEAINNDSETQTTKPKTENNEVTGNDENDNKVETTAKPRPTVMFLEDIGKPQQPPRPNTVANVFGESDEAIIAKLAEDNLAIPVSPTSPRRASKAGGVDFFKEGKKQDLISLRLAHARSFNYTDDVKKFCEDLEEIKPARKIPNMDYYSLRLQLSLEQANSKSTVNVPGTPEDENKRSVGNLFVKSLTVPDIDWNFSKPVN